jgi:hypothetical protein
MIRVVPAAADRFAEIAPLFHLLEPPVRPWRALFDLPWPTAHRERGFVLEDAGRVVGFFGTVWRGHVCNLSTWVTLPEYRAHSLRLLQAVLGLEDCTLTCHTPDGKLYPLYKKFGFADLETHVRVLPPCPPLAALWPAWRTTTCVEKIAPRLHGREAEICAHHRGLRCGHLLVWRGDEYCYVIFTRTRGRRAWFAQVQWISHPQIFAARLGDVRRALLLATGTPLVMIGRRLVEGLALPGREVALATPAVYRSATLRPADIDNLYSEVLLLGL